MNELGNHLWQSTIFAAIVAAASFALRRNRARVRYWLWLAASLKFLVPFSLLIVSGARLKLPPVAPAATATQGEQISFPFEPVSLPPTTASRWPSVLLAVWAAGALWFAALW